MNSANETSTASKPSRAKPYHFCFNSCRERKCGIVLYAMIIASAAKNFPFIVKMSSIEKKMKKQHKAFSIHEIMQILADNTHVGTWVDLVAMLGLLVLTLNTIVSKWSEIEKSYSHCGLLFCTE